MSQHDILPTGPGRPDLPARPGSPAEPGGPGGPMGPGGPLPTGTPNKRKEISRVSCRAKGRVHSKKVQVGHLRLNLNVLWTSELSLCIIQAYALWCVHGHYDRSAMVCKHLGQCRVSSRRLLICFVGKAEPSIWLGLKISITLLLLLFVPFLFLFLLNCWSVSLTSLLHLSVPPKYWWWWVRIK